LSKGLAKNFCLDRPNFTQHSISKQVAVLPCHYVVEMGTTNLSTHFVIYGEYIEKFGLNYHLSNFWKNKIDRTLSQLRLKNSNFATLFTKIMLLTGLFVTISSVSITFDLFILLSLHVQSGQEFGHESVIDSGWFGSLMCATTILGNVSFNLVSKESKNKY